ncbi:MAG: MCE family protein [Thermoleophilia bacterium]|nr:MCE family protein [Thermoleophilia bacterium]
MESLKKWSKRYAVHLTAVVVMIVVALGVGGYILSHQRLYLPAWMPVIGTDFYVVNGEFETAQAVTPGQGQTVNIAGVPVGEIANVKLRNGKALVQMKIRRAHSPIYHNATLWVRPKTPLNDMYIDLKPGTKSAGAIPENGVVPLSNTKSTVNFDEFLSVLDSDTRDYLQLLLNGAGQGLHGRGGDLRQGFKRFAPTGKYGVRIVKQLQLRRKNIRRAITNLALLSKELGDNSDQFASLIDSSSVTFRTWAGQQQAIRQIIQKAPAAFGETADAAKTAQRVVADSAIAFRDLEPLARDFGVSLKSLKPFFKDQAVVTEKQFRPVTRDSQPLLNELAPAASGFKKLAPDATKATASFNKLLDTVAYNPPGAEEGYLYWLTWFNHLGASAFSRADAAGPLQSGAIIGTGCDFNAGGAAANGADPYLTLLYDLTGLPKSQPC